MKERKAVNFGGSIAVTIPPYIAEAINLKPKDKVSIELQNKKIIIRKEETK